MELKKELTVLGWMTVKTNTAKAITTYTPITQAAAAFVLPE